LARILSPPQESVFLPPLTLRWGSKTTQEVGKRKLPQPLSSAQSRQKGGKAPFHAHAPIAQKLEEMGGGVHRGVDREDQSSKTG
jgi:hypothetical protein